jgi:hypothetical protein
VQPQIDEESEEDDDDDDEDHAILNAKDPFTYTSMTKT